MGLKRTLKLFALSDMDRRVVVESVELAVAEEAHHSFVEAAAVVEALVADCTVVVGTLENCIARAPS